MVPGFERWVGMCCQVLDHGMDSRSEDHGRGWGYRDFVNKTEFVLERAVLVGLQGCGGMNNDFGGLDWRRYCGIVENLLARRGTGH